MKRRDFLTAVPAAGLVLNPVSSDATSVDRHQAWLKQWCMARDVFGKAEEESAEQKEAWEDLCYFEERISLESPRNPLEAVAVLEWIFEDHPEFCADAHEIGLRNVLSALRQHTATRFGFRSMAGTKHP